MLKFPTTEALTLLIKPKYLKDGLKNWEQLCAVMKASGMDSPASMIGAAATIAVETAHSFCPISEYGDITYFHKMYGSRKDYAVDAAGLWLWRGRGLIQLTGLHNYTAAAYDLKLDLTKHPEIACHMPEAARIFAWYWRRARLPALCEAAAKTGNWEQPRRAVNGGLNGFSGFQHALEILGAL